MLNDQLQHLMLISLVIEMFFAIPAGMILKRMGFSMWWALLCFVPIAGLFGLWLLAFVKWPRDGGGVMKRRWLSSSEYREQDQRFWSCRRNQPASSVSEIVPAASISMVFTASAGSKRKR